MPNEDLTTPPQAPVAQAPPPPPPPVYPYAPNHKMAACLLGAALAILFVVGGAALFCKHFSGYKFGGAAAAIGILLVLALILEAPTLIMDDSPAAGGEPSTMRIMTLAIVLTFCLLMLRTGWNDGNLPPLESQSQWVWLITACLGGKAVQKFAEIRDKNQ